uniref:THUMP-like domain-containing protein n=1 Tax=Roseivirga sp. TaxID=1964215 RepID=UPI00404731DC
MIEALLKPEVQKFIRDHENDDPVALILKAKQFKNIPVQQAIEQIQSRKKAKTKLPSWYASNQLIFPPPLSIEQSSSEQAAKYKAELFKGESFVDLTGGMGIDFSFIIQSFNNGFYVERQPNLAALATHNFNCLEIDNVEILNKDGEAFIKNTEKRFDLIYLDPARRGLHQQKVFRVEDCEPNVIALMPFLKEKGQSILIKMSPLLDIKGAIADLGGATEVHIIAINNEVKELLFLIDIDSSNDPLIKCIDLNNDLVRFQFRYNEEEKTISALSETKNYLYEPNVALLKAGAFKAVSNRYGLKKLHANSHLYTSEKAIFNFPGRSFKVLRELKLNKTALKMAIPDMKLNITVRNYPASVEEIRKKTGLKDGGAQYLFATTDQAGRKLILCEKIEGQQ